jgi:hypothetical protein
LFRTGVAIDACVSHARYGGAYRIDNPKAQHSVFFGLFNGGDSVRGFAGLRYDDQGGTA